MVVRIATFNVENLDSDDLPALNRRIAVMRPQLERINADILCLQEIFSEEVGGQRQLDGLDRLIAGTPYTGFNRESTRTTDNELYAERNLVVLSRFAINDVEMIRDSTGPRPEYQRITAQPPDQQASPLRWERPILYTEIALPGGRALHLMNVHMKSKIASDIPNQKINDYTWRTASAWAEGYFIASMKRVGQAVQVRLKIDEIFDNVGDDQAFIAVVGDFNAESHEVPLLAIRGLVEDTGNPDHAPRIMIPCENNIPETSRFSLLHLGKGNMLDHIVASRPLFRHFLRAEIHNEALPDESGAFRSDTKFPESDHAPVIAEFDL